MFTEDYLILGERCLGKSRAEVFQKNNRWYFAFSVKLSVPRLRGSGIAGIDVGARNLVALVGVSDTGEAFPMLFKSRTLRAYWLKCQRLARRRQRIAYQHFWEAVKYAESGDKKREKECFGKYRLFLRKTGRFRKKAREVRKKAVNQMLGLLQSFLKKKVFQLYLLGIQCAIVLVERTWLKKLCRSVLRNCLEDSLHLGKLSRLFKGTVK